MTSGSRDMEFRHYEHPKNKKLYFRTLPVISEIFYYRGVIQFSTTSGLRGDGFKQF